MALSTTVTTSTSPSPSAATKTTTHALPQQSWLLATPRSHGCCEDSSHNPYHFMPRAPPRRRELSTSTSTNEFAFLQMSNNNNNKSHLLSDRLFLNIDSRNDRFGPLLPIPTKKSMKTGTNITNFKSHYHNKHVVRRRSTILFAITTTTTTTTTNSTTTTHHNNKKKLVSSSSSSSKQHHHHQQQQQHPPLICAPWIKMRSRRGGLLRVERRENGIAICA